MTRHFTRNGLHASVWEVPPGKLICRFGLTHQELLAVCSALSVPLPPLSFWRRRRRGENVTSDLLPPTNGPLELWMGSRIEFTPPVQFAWTRDHSLLSVEEIEILTGRKMSRRQCEALFAMNIPFAINVRCEPLVPRSAVEGAPAQARREVKLIQQRIELLLRISAPNHLQHYRQAFARWAISTRP